MNIILLAVSLFFGLCSCEPDHTYADDTEPAIELYQIRGTWQLKSWNGAEVSESGLYAYIVFDTKELTVDLYQNFDSMYGRHLTGTFSLEYDSDEELNIISGIYDNGTGFWNGDYVVTDVTDDSMTWLLYSGSTKAADYESSDVCVYERVDEVPADIVAGTRSN